MCFRWLYTRLHCLISLLLGVLIALALESLEHCVFRQPESDLRFCIFALLSLWAKQVAHVRMFEPHIIFPRTLQLFFAIRGYGLTPRLDGFSKDPKILPSFETWDEDIIGWWTMGGITYLATQSILFEYGDWNTEKCFMTQDSQSEMCQSKNHLIKKAEVCHFDVFFPNQSWIQVLFGCQWMGGNLRTPRSKRKICEAPTALPSKLGLAVSISAVAQAGIWKTGEVDQAV